MWRVVWAGILLPGSPAHTCNLAFRRHKTGWQISTTTALVFGQATGYL
ncbi:MAG: hypothetical protein [Podoviridae sp. cty5g4]|nr:MAG: hypothetical protein [Podoviridae sp. cty5g4]